MIKNVLSTGIAVLFALFLGSFLGVYTDIGELISPYVDYLILTLVFLVLLDIKLDKVVSVVKDPKVVLICLITNFTLIPFVGFGLAYIFLHEQPIFALGVVIYCMSPCTDWFLGFTRLAKGNTALGSILLPINMVIQCLLYPIFLTLFSTYLVPSNTELSLLPSSSVSEIMGMLLNWFLVPTVLAIVFNTINYKFLNTVKDKLTQCTDAVLYVLVFCIFAVNIQSITENYILFAWVLLTVLVFFGISFCMTEFIARKMCFSPENKALYTMTTTARNAPFMLGLTMTALPNQPLVYTTIVVGMLIEFPYLALLAVNSTYVKSSSEKLFCR